MPTPQLIAHRGYALRFPENTLASVEGAIAAGARFVEIDVQLSRDRVPYLLHDRTLERMCGVAGSIDAYSSAELAKLHASEAVKFGAQFANEPLATLAGFADVIARNRGVHAFVEIKRASLDVFGVDVVLDAVVRAIEPIESRATLISFGIEVLAAARERTQLPIGPVLIDWIQLGNSAMAALAPEVIFCDVDKLPLEGPLRALGTKLAVYEVDSPQLALELAARGVDMIETFQIREMSSALAAR